MRLEFYTMPFVVYSLGALVSYNYNNFFFLPNYLIGYLVLFLIELATVLTNEYYDFEADKLNKNVGRFTGGSRMLIENKISPREVRCSIAFVLFIIFISSSYLFIITLFSNQVLFLLLIGVILGVSYTAPPLKLSYRGLGELDVAFIHGFYVIFCGYVFQKGILDFQVIMPISIPIFFSSLAGVSLAGLPDIKSDIIVSKKSIAVLIGPKKSLYLSMICSIITGIYGIFLWQFFISWHFSYLYLLIPIYSLILGYIILRLIKTDRIDLEIDKLIMMAMFMISLSSFIPFILVFLN
ncbi:MAG: prenyltransferase [Candidatus Methanofastidiosa archaeon]|nr:prenyltransferase [Candidatus Methanofastidiosa archaeon]